MLILGVWSPAATNLASSSAFGETQLAFLQIAAYAGRKSGIDRCIWCQPYSPKARWTPYSLMSNFFTPKELAKRKLLILMGGIGLALPELSQTGKLTMAKNLIRSIVLTATLAGAAVASQAAPVTVTFNEAGGPSGVLDGTTFYQSYGIANFGTASRFGSDSRLPDDGFGITNTGPSGSVIFGEDVSAVGMTWAVSGRGITFVAELYDAADLLLETFSSGGVGLFGNASFSASNVRKVVFHDGGSQVAIDTLTYNRGTVPEPATLALFGLALAGAAAARRRKA